MGNKKDERHENAGPENDVLFNEYVGFKVIYVYARFMGVLVKDLCVFRYSA